MWPTRLSNTNRLSWKRSWWRKESAKRRPYNYKVQRIHTCIHPYIHTCIHTYIHTRTSVYIYIYTHNLIIQSTRVNICLSCTASSCSLFYTNRQELQALSMPWLPTSVVGSAPIAAAIFSATSMAPFLAHLQLPHCDAPLEEALRHQLLWSWQEKRFQG